MLTLAVDTSTRHCSMALLRVNEVLAKTGGVTEEPYASRVFSDSDKILALARLQIPQIELFAVVAGPGSFTGLRVGLTVVKGWAEVFGRPIAAVSGLEAVAVQSKAEGLIAPVIDARGGQLFGALYRKTAGSEAMELVGEEVVMPFREFGEWLKAQAGGREPVMVTPTLEIIRTALVAAGLENVRCEEVSGELAPFVGVIGQERARHGRVLDALTLEANYLRKSDAEVKWRGA